MLSGIQGRNNVGYPQFLYVMFQCPEPLYFVVVGKDQSSVVHELRQVGRLATRCGAEITDKLIWLGVKGHDRDGRRQGLRKEISKRSLQSGSRVFEAMAFQDIISDPGGVHPASSGL
jgi:hypothetical protein